MTQPPIRLVDIQAQHAEIRAELEAAVQEVFDSGHFILGTQAAAFEGEFAEALGVRHAVGVNSGTDALVLALDAVRLQRGPGEVVTTPFTFFATAEAVLQAGHALRFADIDPDTFNLDPAAVAAIAGRTTVAVMPVHLFGQCADMDRFDGDYALIEDAAQAVGATYRGRPAGALGAAAGFSFYVTKNLGAAGDAGAVTTDDPEMEALVRSLRAHGEVKGEGGRTYHYERLGRNSRLDGLQAAVLRVKLKRLAAWQERREAHAAFYDEALAGIDGLKTPVRTGEGRHVFHQYTVRSERRDALRKHLADAGIQSNVFYPAPLHLQPALADLGFRAGQFPAAERACNKVLSLPVQAHLPEDGPARVVEAVRAFFGA